jgi:uncharacterized small protein (DUF1192 family)
LTTSNELNPELRCYGSTEAAVNELHDQITRMGEAIAFLAEEIDRLKAEVSYGKEI